MDPGENHHENEKRQNLAAADGGRRSVWLEDAAYLRGNWRSLMPQAR